jgi:hypothetical protein
MTARQHGFLLGAVLGVLALVAGEARADLGLKAYETAKMRLVYLDERHEYILPHMARCFENSLTFHSDLFDYVPGEKVTILLQDFDDYGYAGATAMPNNYLALGIEPFEYVYETSPTNERIHWVMSHELLHVVASDQQTSSDRRARKFFGGKVAPIAEAPLSMLYSYLTTPRMYAPRWYHEGMAVFMETWMAGGYGRALGGYDEMVFRTMVADDAYFYDTIGLESEGKAIDFQIGQVSYLYGTRFISYLADTYGPESVLAWLNRNEGSKASYRAQFKQVYGQTLDEGWRQWIEWERGWQKDNLEIIREYPVTEFEPLSERPLGSVSRAYFDAESRTLYSAVNYPAEFAHITAINVDTWEVEKIAEVATPALYYVSSLAFDPDSKTIFFTTDNSSQWRDLNAVDVATGKTTVLLEDFRTGDLAFNRADKTIWGVRHHNGLSTIVRISPPYTDWDDVRDVLTLPYGQDVFDIDVSPDGKYLSAAWGEVSGRKRLVLMRTEELLSGEDEPETLYEFDKNSPANFVFSPDGRYLYGTSYYTGASNIARFDLETRKLGWLTNTETGFFRPLPLPDGQLIAFHYTAKGFVPVILAVREIEDINAVRFLGQSIVEKHPMVKDWMLGSPRDIDLDALEPKQRDYTPAGSLQLTNVYPILESYRDETALGVRLDFMDPIGINRLTLSASGSPSDTLPSDERAHLALEYQRYPWDITATLNRADFYDFFGPTKTSRKGYSLSVGRKQTLINDKPRRLDMSFRLSGYGDLDTLPEYQNVASSVEDYLSASFKLDYRSYRRSIGGLEPEKGVEWDFNVLDKYVLTALASDIESDHFPRMWASLGKGFALPIDHSSLWILASAGQSFGDRDNPLANFYFGGFGNNWVDHGEIRRYREFYSLPGLEINELPGKNFAKLTVDWRLPPVRFKRLGVPSAYVTWAGINLFASGISTDFDSEAFRRTVSSVGAQIDLKLVIFTNLSTTLSLGYAQAFEGGLDTADEFMVSLKIL